MAATYPLEVVEAARWTQANPNLKGDAAVAGGQGQGLGRQREVAGRLPADAGDDEQQPRLDPEARRRDDRPAEGRGRFHPAPARQGGGGRQPQDDAAAEGHDADRRRRSGSAIVIEPANPEVIYVPYYNPTWAYGPWPYPAYPPVYYPPPPNYGAALATGMMFGLGVAAGAAMFGGWHWGWSGGGWGDSYTTVNVNRATNDQRQQLRRQPLSRWPVATRRRRIATACPIAPGRARALQPDAAGRPAARAVPRPAARAATQAANREQARRPIAQDRQPRRGQRPEARGSENRSSAFDGVDRGGQVNRDYDRGRSSWGDRSFDRGGGGFERGGGFHGGGRR